MTDHAELIEQLRFALRDWEPNNRRHFPSVNALTIDQAATALEEQAARIAELEAFEARVRSACDFVEPQSRRAQTDAIADDLAAGMSLRATAQKHGTTFGIVRGIKARQALTKGSDHEG